MLNTPSLFDSLRVNSSYQRTKLVNGAQQITMIGVVYVVTFIDYTEQRLRKIKTLLRTCLVCFADAPATVPVLVNNKAEWDATDHISQ